MEEYNIKINDYPAEYGEVELEPITDKDKAAYDEGYKKGMEEAWRLSYQLVKFPCSKLEDIFSLTLLDGCKEIFSELTVEEAKEGLERYERKKKCKKCNWYGSQDAQWPTGCPCDSCRDGCNFTGKIYPEYHVGDEIEDDKTVCIITHLVDQSYANVIYSNKGERGKGYAGYVNPRDYTKTGKIYPDIEKIINELGR